MYLLKILLIFSISLTSLNSYAEDVVFVEKGKPAPYDGLLFTPEKAKEIRIKLIDGELAQSSNDSFRKTIELQKSILEAKDKQNTILLDQNDRLAKAAYDSQKMSTWEKVGYFVGGIIVFGLAIEASRKLY